MSKPRVWFSLVMILSASASPAQIAPSRSAAAASEQSPVVLSPFTVATEKDTGYIASDSLMGGRISTNLLTTPSDVSVLTRDFLNDIAADSYQDAAVWLTGATVTPSPNQDFGTDVSFRGIGNVNGGYPSRNYFRYNNGVDGYIADRLEAARGPNSLLFGDGVVSGVLNTITKRARIGYPSTEFQTRIDSETGTRMTADVNRPVGKNAAVRVNLLGMEGRNWVDTYYNNRLGLQIAAAWRVWQGGELHTEMEWMRWRTNYAPQNVTDIASSWDRVTAISAPLAANPAASAGISRFTTDRLVFGPSLAGVGLQNYRNFGASTGTSLTLNQTDRGVARFPTIARNFSVEPDHFEHQSNYRVLGAYFTQEIGRDFSFELAAQRVFSPHKNWNGRWNAYTIDVNTVLPNGARNPNFGKAYTDVSPSEVQNQDNRHTDFRLAAVYVLPIKSFSQRFNVIASKREELFLGRTFTFARTNGPIANLRDGNNTIFIRRYFDEADAPFEIPASSNGVEIGRVPTVDRFQRQELDTLQVASVGSYWHDRISVIGGARRDRYTNNDRGIGTLLPTGFPDPNGYTVAKIDVRTTTSSIGTVFFPVKWLGAYANYAVSFNPAFSGTIYLDGSLVQPTQTRGKSAGLRFNLGGRVVGSLGYYNTFEHGRNTSYSSTEINRLWTNVNQAQKQIDPSGYRDSMTAGGSGYEADFVANLTKSIRVRFNYAKPDNQQKDTVPQLRSYFAANIATWQAAADNPANTFRSQIQADINALRTRIENANEGRRINGLPAYTSNLFVNYTIPSGALKSLRLGAGANFVGRTIVGNEVGRPFEYVYRDAYGVASAVIGYSFRVRETRWDMQLNLSNVLDFDRPIYTGTTTFQSRTVMQGFYYLEPRKATLTTTLRF